MLRSSSRVALTQSTTACVAAGERGGEQRAGVAGRLVHVPVLPREVERSRAVMLDYQRETRGVAQVDTLKYPISR
jgi:hypothetical protein